MICLFIPINLLKIPNKHQSIFCTLLSDTFPLGAFVNFLYSTEKQTKVKSTNNFFFIARCPHCSFRAFMDPADKVFRCQSDPCKKETCRYCQVEWEEHFGKKCSEVEKKDETKLRLEYEEKMTMAKVRVCHRCKAQFMKLDGCNKMTCRCGAKMCYICRQPNIDYNHFCQHPRDPGKGCKKCQACSLWTNPEEDENRAVAEMQKEAEEERKKKGYTETKVIGVPSQPPAKKVKR